MQQQTTPGTPSTEELARIISLSDDDLQAEVSADVNTRLDTPDLPTTVDDVNGWLRLRLDEPTRRRVQAKAVELQAQGLAELSRPQADVASIVDEMVNGPYQASQASAARRPR